jgi:hypothetical protein
MRATEIIRGILDIIDQVEEPGQEEGTSIAISMGGVQSPEAEMMPLSHDAESINRFKQIVDLLPNDGEMSPLSNSPNEKYADIDAITKQSGDDMHKSKNPADIRSNATSMYPGYQHDPRN